MIGANVHLMHGTEIVLIVKGHSVNRYRPKPWANYVHSLWSSSGRGSVQHWTNRRKFILSFELSWRYLLFVHKPSQLRKSIGRCISSSYHRVCM